MTQPLVITHAQCIDGFTAAWVARRTWPECEVVFARYGDPPPDVSGRTVCVFDFAYPRPVTEQLIADAASFYCADHHKSAQADLTGLPNCHFHMGMSGAHLAWEHFNSRSVDIPWLVEYTEDRDLWRFALPHSEEVNAWIGTVEMTYKNWDLMSKANFGTLALRGEAVLSKVRQYVREMVQLAYPCRLPYPQSPVVPCVNAPYINMSEVVGALAQGKDNGANRVLFAAAGDREGVPLVVERPDYAIGWFHRPDGKYQYSLRSRGEFDVAEVVELFGGGGHRNAAGFTVDQRVDERV